MENVAPASGPWRPDGWLCFGVTVALGFGIVMPYTASAVYAEQAFGDGAYFLKAQLARMALGVVALVAAVYLPTAWLRRRSGWMLLAATILCAVVLIPGVGRLVGGARRWLAVGPVTFQPSELAKIGVILVLGALLARRETMRANERVPWLVPILMVQLPIALVFEGPDFGSALVIELIVMVMLLAAGLKLRAFVVAGICVSPILYHALVGTEFRLKRLLSALNPWAYSTTTGYQSVMSQISIGSGGWFGRGLGESKQRLFYLPEAHTDFVFAILAEELGLVGVLCLLTAFGIIFWRGFHLAMRATLPFHRYVALGLTSLIAIPTVLNLAVVTGLLPTTGLPLPFVSYGGTSLVVSLAAVGVLLRIHFEIERST